jgi:cobalamin biosynthesis Co2+ chelatase CbiK
MLSTKKKYIWMLDWGCTKIDQSEDNTTEIKHRISQTSKDINVLNSICWHKIITKNKNYIFMKL